MSNVYNFCAKNISKYTKLREEISRLLQDPAVIEDKTHEKLLQDVFLLGQDNKEITTSLLNKKTLDQKTKLNNNSEVSKKVSLPQKKWWNFWK
ncbi:hypothetical protein JTY60_01265 [symbiont of Argiope bruennichi]|uniref:hypothetical protein n=1 Tax=symbiont of Argiope bruennichi TaxID=2810479 RepID=UPI003DA26BC7